MAAKFNFTISYGKNEGLILNPSELYDLYFYGIKIKASDGSDISKETLKTVILAAQGEIEKTLNIKLIKQLIVEDRGFYYEDYAQWGYVRTSYPVNEAYKLDGRLNQTPQITFPKEWLSIKKGNQGLYYRHIYIVPNQGAVVGTQGILFPGATSPYTGLAGAKIVPNYWNTVYVTGFDLIPADLLNFIGKLASINIFRIMGDIILGAGISNYSLGIDGLSQSISTQAGYKNRIDGYLQDMKDSLPRLINYYKGFTISSF